MWTRIQKHNSVALSETLDEYSGLFDPRKGPQQPSVDEWSKRVEKRSKMISLTSNPEVAYNFSEGVGAVLIDQIPISSILASPFTVPAFRELLQVENEFLGKLNIPRVRSPGSFRGVIESYKKSGYGPETLIGYSGFRRSNVWRG